MATISDESLSAAVSATDAGSTRASSLNLGTIDGAVAAQGQVSYFDQLDVYAFDIESDGEVAVELSGLFRNADLIFADESGRVLDVSRQSGASAESIQLDLEAGRYYIAVQARSFWGTSYRLDVEATLETLPPIPTPIADPLAAPGVGNDTTPLPSVPYFGGSVDWNVNAVEAPEAWAAGYTGQGILVAVVDTGVDLDHPDLVNNLYVNPGEIAGDGIDNDGNGFVDDIRGYDFVGRDANPNDGNGHGTHVAGTIAADLNGVGATGIAPDATILPVRVLGNDGSGSTNSVAAGIRYAAELGADIINLSLGGGYSRAIDAAIQYAESLGSLIIAAAGNESAALPGYPARFSASDDNVLSVGAHDQRNQIARFSNDVGNSGAVQIDAPGVGIYSTYIGGGYATLSGTSMASPHVAGVAALALSAAPDLRPSELRSLLVSGAIDVALGSDAAGQLSAATTVAYAASGLTAAPIASTAVSNNSAAANGATTFGSTQIGETTYAWANPSDLPPAELSISGEQSIRGGEISPKRTSSSAGQSRFLVMHQDLTIAERFTSEIDATDSLKRVFDSLGDTLLT
ncbi:MAG: S8 family serine peptidase [Planctomycetota bacterium]